MRKAAIVVAIAALWGPAALAQIPQASIRDTLLDAATGQPVAYGKLEISWPQFTYGSQTVPRARLAYPVINGVVYLSLTPTDQSVGNVQYTVVSTMNGASSTACWQVPSTGGPFQISQLIVPCSSSMILSGSGGSSSGGGGANAAGYYLVSQANNAPSNAVNLGLLNSGLLKITVAGGVAAFSNPTISDLTSLGSWPWASLSNVPSSFTPSPHALSHAAAGSDPLSLSASQIGAGYPYASLSGAPSIPAPSSAMPAMDGTGAAGSAANYARADHQHPVDTSRQAALSSYATIAALLGYPSSFTPSAHASSHQNGGSDEIATSTPAANAIPKAGSAGTLASGWIPAPTLNTFGGVKAAAACASGNHVAQIDTSGTPQCTPDTGAGGLALSGTPATNDLLAYNGTAAADSGVAVSGGVVTAAGFQTTGVGGTQITFTEGAAPSAPSSGQDVLYFDSTAHFLKSINTSSALLYYLSAATLGASGNGVMWNADGTLGDLGFAPAQQVQPDWNAVSGLGQILHQPTIPLTYGAIVGFWTSCSAGYLKYDGTCSTPAGTSVNVNGSSVASPNFNGAAPAAQSGYINATLQVSGSNVSIEIPDPGATYQTLANLDTTSTLGASDTHYPSQKAVKTYVDNAALSAGGTPVGTATGSLTVTALPDLGCADQTFTFTGITTATQISPGWPSTLPAGISGNMWASAASTVTVRLCNSSGTAITFGPLTYTAKIANYYLTASATPTFSAIVDGACASQNITLTGASAGDPVVAGPPAAFAAGLRLDMVVSAASTVAARVCNWSGASATPSGTFTAMVAK